MVWRWFSSAIAVVASEGREGTRHGAARLMLVLGISGLIVVAGGLVIGIDGFQPRAAVDEARHETIALRAQQEALRNQAFELAERSIEVVERGQRIARLAGASRRDWESESPPLPARNCRNEALLDWLSEQQAVLAALEKDMAADQAEAGRVIATVLTPVSTVTVPARDAPLLQSAHMESIRR